MRRLFLPFVLAAAAAVASPAAADPGEPDGFLCAGVTASGERLAPVTTGTHCLVPEYRYAVNCHDTDVWSHPHVMVETWICVPAG